MTADGGVRDEPAIASAIGAVGIDWQVVGHGERKTTTRSGPRRQTVRPLGIAMPPPGGVHNSAPIGLGGAVATRAV